MPAEGVAADVLQARPAPEVWSAAEYVDHCADIVRLDGLGLAILLSGEDITVDEDGVEVPTPPPDVRFDEALEQETQHVNTIRGWYEGLLTADSKLLS